MKFDQQRGRVAKHLGKSLSVFSLGCMMAGWMALAGSASALEIQQKKQVVEMFTSQGCSSCPPADALLMKLGEEKDVLALAWHVDYWDYIGWKDVFGSPAFTERQKEYSVTLDESRIYTPQAVVNGQDHAVGSSEGNIRGLMKKDSGLLKPMEISVANDQLSVNFKPEAKKPVVLTAVWYDNLEKTEIKRGENRGKTIAYSDIVKTSKQFAKSKDGALAAKISVKDLKGKGQNCAILVQEIDGQGNPAKILSAAVIEGL